MNDELEKILTDAEKIYTEFEDKLDELWKYRNKSNDLFDVWYSYEQANIAFNDFLNVLINYRNKHKN